MTDLNLIFQSLPTPVKDWLASDLSQNVLNDIGQKYSFDLNKDLILSQLFLRLVTQDLPPQNFTGALQSELGLKKEEAAEMTRIIDEKIIEPISGDLLAAGFDRKLLYYTAPPPAKLEPQPSLVPPSAPPTTAPTPAKLTPFDAAQDKPFILHEEKEIKPSFAESQTSGPSFIYKPASPAKISEEISASKPIKVTIERVVHYNNFYTPLNRAPLRYYQKIKVPKSKWFV